MTFEFNGETFRTMHQFSQAYPVYRHYADLVKGGISTVTDLEKAIAQRMTQARKIQTAQARANNKGFSVKNRRGAR